MAKRPGLPLSSSVTEANRRLADSGPVTSWEIVKALLELHPEYGEGRGKDLLYGIPSSEITAAYRGEPRPVGEWLEAVDPLYDPKAVEVLDGRLMIIGLTLIDRNLDEYISDRIPEFIEILKHEGGKDWRRPFEEVLLPQQPEPEFKTKSEEKPKPSQEQEPLAKAKKQPKPRKKPEPGTRKKTESPKPPPPPDDPAVQHDDSPAKKDVLGRGAFAHILAFWFNRLWKKKQKEGQGVEGNSFITIIYGPWGSGKTTLLSLLKANLQQAPGWIFVEFNAWQHQHLTPVWWPLLDKVYRDVVTQLSKNFLNLERQAFSKQKSKARQIRYWEWGWRLFTGRKLYLLTLGVCVVAFLTLLGLGNKAAGSTPGTFLAQFKELEPLLKILAFLGTLWSAFLALTRSLLPGSISSAEMFQQFTRDPLEKVKKHYQRLVYRFDYPVMVFIDDLDRCQPEYVVKLLEGIQTLFNSTKVFYVIAADRRWLHKCFETQYQSLADSVLTQGRRMGHLFLEKVFQLEVPVPRLSPRFQEVYLDYLVRGEQTKLEKKLEEARKKAEDEFQEAASEEEILNRLKACTYIDPIMEQARREAAIRQSATREVEVSTEYYLRKFAHLLEPNPRAMKRLVTAYGVYRAQAWHEDPSLMDTPEKQDQFVLWIIVRLRWPLLEEYLVKDPEKIDDLHRIYRKEPEGAAPDPDLLAFAKNKDVEQVLSGEKVGVRLDQDAVRRQLQLKE